MIIRKGEYFILTCKLGDNIINCYDEIHNKEQLKKWASKRILLCPICGKPYEYCHGKVKTPYFRHMDKNECDYLYSESETEEHLNGKRDLFEWIKNQNGITNVILEGWIPKTKQRPDIMFEYNNKKYVIEYQCTPISSEYIERHDLYNALGIVDIWICGTEKYLKNNMKEKFIEQYSNGFYNSTTKEFIIGKYNKLNYFLKSININNNVISKAILYNKSDEYFNCKLSDTIFYNDNFIIPKLFYNVNFEIAINTHNIRAENNKKNILNKKEYIDKKIVNILNLYCDKSNKISYTKCEYDLYKLFDKTNEANYRIFSLNDCVEIYQGINKISKCIKNIVSEMEYNTIINNLNRFLDNKLHGKYEVYYKNFGEGEYIDIDYDDFIIRSVIKDRCLTISIYDPCGYMRKNYKIFSNNNYNNRLKIIDDIINNSNMIYDNNVKVKKAINIIINMSNKNWIFDFNISPFNIVTINLYPIIDQNCKLNTIGTLKINSNFDKNINISLCTYVEIAEYIKEYFYKKIIYFLKNGIKLYNTEEKFLILTNNKNKKI